MMEHTYAVIMAGGIGSRFWPQSRRAFPKQFLNVFGAHSLIQNTVARLQGLIPPERILIVTNTQYVDDTRRQLPVLPPENILAEPVGRNTAPAIAYAATRLQHLDPDAVMVALPADHVIQDVAAFHKVLQAAVRKAEEGTALVTIGIEPTHPATGYGYIQFEGNQPPKGETPQALPVQRFAEKPPRDQAEQFLASGDFLWNSGMFIWKQGVIFDQIRTHLPEVYAAFASVTEAFDTPGEAQAVTEAFEASPSVSIDTGVMEHAADVYVVPGSFGWNDVGDWRAVYDLRGKDAAGNALEGNAVVLKTSGCLVQAGRRVVALVGVKNLAVIDTDDAVLICALDTTQQVKTLRNRLEEEQTDVT